MLGLVYKKFGRWLVVDEDGETVLGPVPKAEAQAYIAAAGQPEIPADQVSADDRRQAEERVKEREWAGKLEAQQAAFFTELEEKYRVLLVTDFGEDAAIRLMRDLSPMLKAGKEYRRRERIPFIGRTVKAA